MKIICIGRNYVEHAKELNNKVPTEPLFFLKPDSSILPNRKAFYIPEFSSDVHFEVEVILKINRLGKNIEEQYAHRYFDEIGLGIDFTARDLQAKLKEKGHPWEKAKGFDGAAVVSNHFHPVSKFEDVNRLSFSLTKNGEVVQKGATKDMIFSPSKIISYVSKFMTLKMGDLIFTGTPAGVGPVTNGDVLEGYIGETHMFRVKVK